MNKLLNSRLLSLVAAILMLPAIAVAAADMYLKIGDIKGESKIVHCPDGACVVDGLAPGKYTVQVCDVNGVIIPTDLALEYAVKSPRDAASGQATGKRQHKPISISKAASAKPSNVIEVAEAGLQVSIQLAGGAAAAPAQDHNSSRSNKTSN